jgi:hypothetical protein
MTLRDAARGAVVHSLRIGCSIARRGSDAVAMPSVHERANAVGRTQRGWATRHQLIERAGVSASSIRRMVAAGRWREVYPGVIDLGSHRPSWHGAVVGAVLAAGPHAWASHATAAYLHGFLDAPRPDRLDVLVVRGRHPRVGRLALHTSSSIGLDEVTEVERIPCTGVARTIFDLAATTSPDVLERYLLNQGRHAPDLVRRVVELTDRHRARPGRRRLLDVIARSPGDAAGLGSPLEVLGIQRLRRLDPPPFELQYEVRDLDGAPIKRVDVAWPALRTALEFDGAAYHDLSASSAQDEQQRARMRACGWHVEVLRRRDLDGPAVGDFVRRLRAVA